MLKKILLGLLVILVVIQFIKPAPNNSNDDSGHVALTYPMPPEVKDLFAKACNDCHTNHTEYPWYSKIQPVAWWHDNHIKDGKRNLNLSTLGTRRINLINHKLEEIIEMVETDEMPLASYTWIHKEAKLTEVQKQWIITWAKSAMDQIKATYPPDSLVMPKRTEGPPAR